MIARTGSPGIDLTSPGAVALFLAVTALVVVAVGVALPGGARRRRAPRHRAPGHRARRRRWSGVGRAGAVALSSLLVLTSCALVVNRPMHYVTTTRDVAGALGLIEPDYAGTAPALVPASRTPTAPPTAPAATSQPTPSGTPTPDPAWVASFTPVGDGSYQATWTGPASGITLPVRVILPSGYAPDDGRTYDVIEFLHGNPGDAQSVVDGLAFPQALQAAIDAGQIPPTIVVVPSLNVDSYEPDCADLAGRPAVGTWVSSEIPGMVRATFPNTTTDRSGWMLAGLSSGAYCAAWTALGSPGTFASVGMLSGYDRPAEGGLKRASPEVIQANTLSTMLAGSRGDAVRLWSLGAHDDPDALAVSRNLAAAAHTPDAVTVDEPTSGGHSWPLWVGALPRLLAWWGTDPAVQAAAGPGPVATPTAQAGSQVTAGASPTAEASPVGGGSPTEQANAPVTAVSQADAVGSGSSGGQVTPSAGPATGLRHALTAIDGAGVQALAWLAWISALVVLVVRGPRWVPRARAWPVRVGAATVRVAAVGAVGLLLAVAVGLGVNAAGGFYTSWRDLWATVVAVYV